MIEDLVILNYTLEQLKTDLRIHVCAAEGTTEAFSAPFWQKIQKDQFLASNA